MNSEKPLSLAQILADAATIAKEIENQQGELEDWLLAWKQQNALDKERKLENYAAFIDRLEMEIELADDKIKFWSKRKHSLSQKLKRTQSWLKYLLQRGEELKAQTVKFFLKKSTTLKIADSFDINNLDRRHVRISIEPNKTLIKKEYDQLDPALKQFITLEKTESVQMKGSL